MRFLILATALLAAGLARGDDASPVAAPPAQDGERRIIGYPRDYESASRQEASESAADFFQGEGSPLGMVFTILGYFVIFGGLAYVAYYLVKRGSLRKPFSKGEGKLRIAESRMLGNRQFLMVVEYDDQKLLLGVGPGKIDYLTSLQGIPSGFPPVEPQPEAVSLSSK